MKGLTIQRAAAEAGVHERTVYRWLEASVFKAELRRAVAEAISGASRLAAHTGTAALHTLLKIMTDSSMSAQARVTAATNILRFMQESGASELLNQRLERLQQSHERTQSMDVLMIADGDLLDLKD